METSSSISPFFTEQQQASIVHVAPELAFSQAASAVALPVLRNQSGAGANRSELRLDLAHVHSRSLGTSAAYAPGPEDLSPCSLGQCQSRVERSERTSGRDHSSVADVPVVPNHAPAAPWARKAREAGATGNMTDVGEGATDVLETRDRDALEFETGCAEQLRSGANFTWGDSSGDSFVKNLLSAYAEVVYWKRNVFLVPSGSSGKTFVRELARVLRALTEDSALAPVAMTAIMTMPHLLLQKPTPKSRRKDHKLHLDRRLG